MSPHQTCPHCGHANLVGGALNHNPDSGNPSGGRGSQIEKVAPFLDLVNLKPFVSEELADSTKPFIFQVPSGSRAFGYRAELLPQVCEVYLKARDAGELLKSQDRFAIARRKT